ncbi:MAG: hypothetical protein J6V11_02850 [Alphaproteobacteria bacterium]|nr:hypothetical protein [Alphaproteobacteria bacterium]
MNNNQKEICPIEYMIASRRPKRKRSMAQRLKKNKAIIQKMLIASGVFSVLTVGAIYSSELCDMTKKMVDNITPNTKRIPKESSFSEGQQISLKNEWDSDLINEIYEQEAMGKDRRGAVNDAFYSLWQRDYSAVESDEMSNEVYRIRSEQHQKRSRQFQQFDWSNIDRCDSMNPFIDMIIKERNGITQDEYQNEVSCIRRNTSISQNNQNLHMALRGNTR